jgi:hypothetical protein
VDPGLAAEPAGGAGPYQAIALLPGSPAIDAGSNALAIDPTTGRALVTDQRGFGFPRIINGVVDIGAYESPEFGCPTIFMVTSTTDTDTSSRADEVGGKTYPSGDLTWAIAQANANTNPSGSIVEYDPSIFATPQTITLTSTLELGESAGPEIIQGPEAAAITILGDDPAAGCSLSILQRRRTSRA